MHTIYEGAIAWTINDNNGHPCQVEIPKYLFVPNGRDHCINPKHWEQNAISDNAGDTILYGTQCVTHRDHDTLIWVGGWFVQTVHLVKHNAFYLHTDPVYTMLSAYCTTVGYDPFYIMTSMTVSQITMLFSVSLRSLIAKRHCLCVHLRLHREKPHIQMEVFETQREPHMVRGVHI